MKNSDLAWTRDELLAMLNKEHPSFYEEAIAEIGCDPDNKAYNIDIVNCILEKGSDESRTIAVRKDRTVKKIDLNKLIERFMKTGSPELEWYAANHPNMQENIMKGMILHSPLNVAIKAFEACEWKMSEGDLKDIIRVRNDPYEKAMLDLIYKHPAAGNDLKARITHEYLPKTKKG